jgi:hypothetical protein
VGGRSLLFDNRKGGELARPQVHYDNNKNNNNKNKKNNKYASAGTTE